MKDFKELIVWKKAHQHTSLIYQYTKSFPKEEQFGIISQIRRAAVSIPANIAEGCGKSTQKDFANYLQTSLGSAQEVEYPSILSFELGYLNDDQHKTFIAMVNEVKAMLISLIKKVRAKN
jgi:four helix bundle protein